MVVKRETLIRERNKSLRLRGIPQKAVVATRTDPAAGLIAWAVRYAPEDPWYRDARDAYSAGKAPKYEGYIGKHQGSHLKLINTGSHWTLNEATKWLDHMIQLYA